jgi:hypothetical protein
VLTPLEGLGDFVKNGHVQFSLGTFMALEAVPKARKPVCSEHHAIPENLPLNQPQGFWNDTARVRSAHFPLFQVQSA